MTADDRTLGRRFATSATLIAGVAYALPALAGAGYAVPVLAPASAAARRRLGIEDRTADGLGCALTFDDGPHPQGTPAVLEILAEAGAVATFFLVGERVRANPALAREILAAGHRIGLHCDRHRNLLRLPPAQVRQDIARAEATIGQATGAPVSLYRPPYGILNAAALRLARCRGWRTLLWSQWGRDWEARATPESIASLATRGLGAGSVVLLHDADDYGAPGSWRRTAAALPLVLARIQELRLNTTAP
jgi:peptidoglycan/xylan/chitin deacetylase (PgdA/CDA1 family)